MSVIEKKLADYLLIPPINLHPRKGLVPSWDFPLTLAHYRITP